MSPQLARRLRWVLLLILALVLILGTTAQRATIAHFSEPILQATPVPIPQPTDTRASTQYSLLSFLIVIALVLLLGLLFWFLFKWSNKLDQASYLGTLYKDTIQDIEFKRLKSDVTEKWDKGEFHKEVVQNEVWLSGNPIPPMPKELAEFEEELNRALLSDAVPSHESLFTGRLTSLGYLLSNKPPNISEEDWKAAKASYSKTAQQWIRKVDIEAKRRYQKDLNEAYANAQKRANRAIDVDLSVLRGRGAEFVLEFTTVVVIIFAAIILGVLGILDTQQIGTLLAAIAGYVLGRATTRNRSSTGGSKSTKDKTSVGENTN
jgi:hypothetical protein